MSKTDLALVLSVRQLRRCREMVHVSKTEMSQTEACADLLRDWVGKLVRQLLVKAFDGGQKVIDNKRHAYAAVVHVLELPVLERCQRKVCLTEFVQDRVVHLWMRRPMLERLARLLVTVDRVLHALDIVVQARRWLHQANPCRIAKNQCHVERVVQVAEYYVVNKNTLEERNCTRIYPGAPCQSTRVHRQTFAVAYAASRSHCRRCRVDD